MLSGFHFKKKLKRNSHFSTHIHFFYSYSPLPTDGADTFHNKRDSFSSLLVLAGAGREVSTESRFQWISPEIFNSPIKEGIFAVMFLLWDVKRKKWVSIFQSASNEKLFNSLHQVSSTGMITETESCSYFYFFVMTFHTISLTGSSMIGIPCCVVLPLLWIFTNYAGAIHSERSI